MASSCHMHRGDYRSGPVSCIVIHPPLHARTIYLKGHLLQCRTLCKMKMETILSLPSVGRFRCTSRISLEYLRLRYLEQGNTTIPLYRKVVATRHSLQASPLLPPPLRPASVGHLVLSWNRAHLWLYMSSSCCKGAVALNGTSVRKHTLLPD